MNFGLFSGKKKPKKTRFFLFFRNFPENSPKKWRKFVDVFSFYWLYHCVRPKKTTLFPEEKKRNFRFFSEISGGFSVSPHLAMREGKKKDDFPGFSGGKKCTFLHFRGIFPPLSKKGVFSGTFSSIPAQNRGKKSAKKGCFSTLFFQIFVFFFRKSATQLPCPSVYMGRKSELRSTEKKNFFFSKIFQF